MIFYWCHAAHPEIWERDSVNWQNESKNLFLGIFKNLTLVWLCSFAKIKKRLGHSLTFTPERLYTKFQKIWLIRLGENALRTDGRTNGRTDGTEIIGPSGKNSGDQLDNENLVFCHRFFKGWKLGHFENFPTKNYQKHQNWPFDNVMVRTPFL